MKRIILLMPTYNDWDSIIKLLGEINSVIKNIKDYAFKCIIVNDCSSEKQPNLHLLIQKYQYLLSNQH